MSKLIEGAKDALAVARGEKPAAVLHHNGHAYVPKAEADALRAKLAEAVEVMKPFADEAKRLDRPHQFFNGSTISPSDNCLCPLTIRLGYLRAAAAFIASVDQAEKAGQS